MSKFWNLVQENGMNVISIDEAICGDDWWGGAGESCARAFRKSLDQCGDVTIRINSPGGEVFAASDMYAAIKAHSGKVTIEITGLAASAASVIAMAGDTVLMAPTANMMIHDPWSVAAGDSGDMRHEAKVLDEIKESIINAYEIKTGLGREKISQLMKNETWMSAHTAIEMGFADGIIGETDEKKEEQSDKQLRPFQMRAALDSTRRVAAMLREDAHDPDQEDQEEPTASYDLLAMAARIWADQI